MMDMIFKMDKMNIIFVMVMMDKMVMMDLRDRGQEASTFVMSQRILVII